MLRDFFSPTATYVVVVPFILRKEIMKALNKVGYTEMDKIAYNEHIMVVAVMQKETQERRLIAELRKDDMCLKAHIGILFLYELSVS